MPKTAGQPAPPSIWWIRRDLRLEDNPALEAALAAAQARGANGNVLPVFVLDPTLLNSGRAGAKRIAFLFAGLRALDAALRLRGSRLILRSGKPVDALSRLCHETGALSIFAERDYSAYAKARDAAVVAELSLTLVDGLTVRPPGEVHKSNGTPYTVFTPFSKAWKAAGALHEGQVLPAPMHLRGPDNIASEELPATPEHPNGATFMPGEVEAKRRLAQFVDVESGSIYDYANTRNRPDLDGTSQLSPYLRFGMLSPRVAVLAAMSAIEHAPNREAARSAEAWLNELVWREFYFNVLHEFPYVRNSPMRPAYANVGWLEDAEGFAAWCDGRTGYPIVDAAMRQLKAEGWIHNRLRMIVASFLVKDLLIDRRLGEQWFMQHLIDGDVAANNGGWQWVAGVGADAAPYFRIFNPVLQGIKFDPEGTYVRRRLPELAQVPASSIHQPWTMGSAGRLAARVRTGVDYPAPIVDHAFARTRALAAFAAVRGTA